MFTPLLKLSFFFHFPEDFFHSFSSFSNLYLFPKVIFNRNMTILFRNTMITLGIVIGFIIFAGSVLTAVNIPPLMSFAQYTDEPQQLILNGSIVLFLILFALISSIILRIYFNKTLAPEMFFFTIFLLTFSFEALRIVIFYIELTSAPFFFGILVTKAVHFGRFLRVFSVFVSGLFACSRTNPKTGTFLGIGAILAFAYASGIPIDATRQSFDFLYQSGINRLIVIIFIGVQFVSVLNFILAGVLKNTIDYYVLSFGLFLTVLGGEFIVIFPAKIYLAAAGAACMVAGTILFSRRTHELYLWE